MNWNWTSYLFGLLTPFAVCAAILLGCAVTSGVVRMFRQDSVTCALCGHDVCDGKARIICELAKRLHRLTGKHRAAYGRWLNGRQCTPVDFVPPDGRVDATFNGRHPATIAGREVIARYPNAVYLLTDSIVRLPDARRVGTGTLLTHDPEECTMTRLGDIQTLSTNGGYISVTGKDNGCIRIPCPRRMLLRTSRRMWLNNEADRIQEQIEQGGDAC